MRRYLGFRGFVRKHERDLVSTAHLLTGDQDSATKLTLEALRDVGLSWPPPPWSNPADHARTVIYRRYLAREQDPPGVPLTRRQWLIAVALLRDGRTGEDLALVLGLPAETVEEELAAARAVLDEETLTRSDAQAPVPGLADRALRLTRRRRLRRLLLPAAVAALLIGSFTIVYVRPLWLFPHAPAIIDHGPGSLTARVTLDKDGKVWTGANGEGSFQTQVDPRTGRITVSFEPRTRPALQTWKPPHTLYTIQYGTQAKCEQPNPALEDVPPPPPPVGTVTCMGWTLHLVAKPGTGSGGLSHVCLNDECFQDVFIPDAAVLVAEGADSWHGVHIAISRDGHRVAYLSGTEHRFVAVDLRGRTKRYLSPILTPDQQRDPRVNVSPDGRFFTVSYDGTRTRTDFTTGATEPDRTQVDSSGEDLGFTVDSPNGKKVARTDSEKSRNGSLVISDSATGRVLKSHALPGLGGASDSEVISWLDDREVLIKMVSVAGREHLGWFRIDVVTGEMRRVPRLPDDNDIVVGAVVPT
jgi:hypothetical protein